MERAGLEFGPRRIKPEPQPLAGYIRPGRNDHTILLQIVSERMPSSFQGDVCDPCCWPRHQELWREGADRGLETVLDTRAMELATEGGFAAIGKRLAWSGNRPHLPADFDRATVQSLTGKWVDFLQGTGLSSVLAPSHFIKRPDDEWLDVDRRLVLALRETLDRSGLSRVPIYYPLALPGSVFRLPGPRVQLKAHLAALPIDAVWMRVSPFGSSSPGGVALRGFVEGCWDLHSLQRPLVAEHSGTVGVALLAFGAVGGIESGVTIGENFDFSRLCKAQEKKVGYSSPRIFVPELMCFLNRRDARALLERRTMRSRFGCQGHWCCTKGADDMLRDPRRHFLARRFDELARLTTVPESMRAQIYMEEVLRPASDHLSVVSEAFPALESARGRLAKWRHTLGALLLETRAFPHTLVPRGQRLRERQTA